MIFDASPLKNVALKDKAKSKDSITFQLRVLDFHNPGMLIISSRTRNRKLKIPNG